MCYWSSVVQDVSQAFRKSCFHLYPQTQSAVVQTFVILYQISIRAQHFLDYARAIVIVIICDNLIKRGMCNEIAELQANGFAL